MLQPLSLNFLATKGLSKHLPRPCSGKEARGPCCGFTIKPPNGAPSSLAIKNNLAFVALLLDAQEFKPHELAREVYKLAPTNSA